VINYSQGSGFQSEHQVQIQTQLMFSPNSSSAMTLLQVLLCILFPPLAVLNRGCGSILIVLLLTAFGWIPGVIAALVILNNGD
jgi:uncharacterized membrane protein YqaE (UPF0057 family)